MSATDTETGTVKLSRTTKETAIELRIQELTDSATTPSCHVGSKIPFLDHMLTTFALYANIAIELRAKGDLAVDQHHTVEDIGLVLGEALLALYNTKKNRGRFGYAAIPMDDSLAEAALDVCNRPYLVYRPLFPQSHVGTFPTVLLKEFFNALTMRARWTLHLTIRYAENSHHAIEALFKAWGRAYAMASNVMPRGEVLSTKGTLSS